MYTIALTRIIKTEEIRQTFLNIRLNVNRISISEFNDDDVAAIDNDYSAITKWWKITKTYRLAL